MFRNNFFHKNTLGESGALSLLQIEKRWSAKSDVSKVLFLDIGKITNRYSRDIDALGRGRSAILLRFILKEF